METKDVTSNNHEEGCVGRAGVGTTTYVHTTKPILFSR
jgi:hypothetical protein